MHSHFILQSQTTAIVATDGQVRIHRQSGCSCQQATWLSIPTARLGALSADLALPGTSIINVGKCSCLSYSSQSLAQILLTLHSVGGRLWHHHVVINEKNHACITAIKGFEIGWQRNVALGRNCCGELDRLHINTPLIATLLP
ncbi:hypothetical protein [Limnohabitans sp. 2KL-51]|uniref:hypothetical protein n=1 Tax=Limnohabitans sp. 2KL-51 TaxID=1977911 RepID=UPI0011B230B9|nr:hypothetical protein [Limnohabitans sp. 2KL-51]